MEVENYYIRNVETGKLNVFMAKAYFEALGPEGRAVFEKFCLWSRKQGCWISKGKTQNCLYLKARLNDLGFINKVNIHRNKFRSN